MERRNLDWQKLELELCEKCEHRLDCLLLSTGECPVSYIRFNHPLTHFKGDSQSYVYVSETGVEDYDDTYEDNPTFCEMIGNMIASETGDGFYAARIVRILAEKLGISDQLRMPPLSTEDYLQIMQERFSKNPEDTK